jgi:hypothetical protein
MSESDTQTLGISTVCFSRGLVTCAIENLCCASNVNGMVRSTKLFPTMHVLHEVNIRK